MGFWSKAKHAVIRSKEEQAEYERRKEESKSAERRAYEKERERQSEAYGKWKAQEEAKTRKKRYKGGGLIGQLGKMAGGSSKRSMPRKSSGKPAKTGKAVKIGGKYYVVDQPKKHKKKKMPRKKNPFDFDFDF